MFAMRAMAMLAVGAVLTLSACSGDDDEGGDATDTADTAGDGGAATAELRFRSTSDFKFDPSTASVAAGTVHIVHENDGSTAHTFVIEGTDFKLSGNDDGNVDLASGEYVFYCDVPGHRDAGMEGTLDVTG